MSRGRYNPSIIGFISEYHADMPISPMRYSSLVPDRVLSYSTDTNTHFDLVILRFGRSERKYHDLVDALNSSIDIKVQNISSFKNVKNTNRLHYLRTVIFPKMGKKYHLCVREWSLTETAKKFDGKDAFLKCLMDNDIMLESSCVKIWSFSQRASFSRTISKYNMVFDT